MAELHGRVCRFSDHSGVAGAAAPAAVIRRGNGRVFWRSVAVAVAALLGCATSPDWSKSESKAAGFEEYAAVPGVALGADDLEHWGRDLRSEEPAVREEAFQAFLRLGEEALPAIRARIESYQPPGSSDEAYRVLSAFRHAVGSRRADDDVDVIPGILSVLAEDRSEATATLAEQRLLVRALADLGTPQAGRLMADLFATDAEAWRWEAKRAVFRMGPTALPILLEARQHPNPRVRRWGRWGLRHLGLHDPGVAVQQGDAALLAATLRAYGALREMDAVAVVASFVTDDRRQVRAAARAAIDSYGQNAVWQLRRAYRNETGERSDPSLGWRETANALYAAFDRKHLEAVRADLDSGLAAQAADDLDAMEERFERALRSAPDMPSKRRMAEGFAMLGRRASLASEWADALRYYTRALRLAPSSHEARRWRAEALFARAQQWRRVGVTDSVAYGRVLSLSPDHAGAIAMLESMADDRGREPGSIGIGIGILLTIFLLIGLGFRWFGMAARPSDEEITTPNGDGVATQGGGTA